MYKRRKRRANNKKGKKREQQQPAIDMSVTTMEVVDNHQTLPVQVQPESKAVGARKRKPTTISKIVEKPVSDLEMDYCTGGDSVTNQNNNNNNNCPPYKKPCLEPAKNGIIRNILTELKSAKEASNRLDVHVLLKDSGQEKEEDEIAEEDNGVSEGENSLRIEEDEDDDGFAYEGCGNERTKSRGRSHSSPDYKKRVAVDYSTDRRGRDRYGEKSDLADIRSILSNTGVSAFGRSNGIGGGGKDTDGDEDESANEEGTDLRSITGNSTGDDELPFRCGVCAYGSCDKSTLLRHMRTHSGERPFQCRLCYFAFTTKANCERHLRNRHFQVDRDQLRNLVVCLPTSSNASESETESNHGATQHTIPSPVVVPAAQIVSHINVRSDSIPDDELPLDLSMDAVDLSTKRRDGNSIFSRKASLHRPRPVYAAPDVPNLLVTSPFVSKREALVHPQLPINNPFTPHSLSQTAAAPGSRTAPFSLFPFGAPPGFNPFGIPPGNVEKLISMGAGSPPKMPNPFLGASPTPTFGSKDMNASIEKESIVKAVKVESVESKRVESNTNSVSSVSPSATSRKRSDNNNGEYQKPKQRRYRTERPFACPHCPARFTLRSNMERHGKHQHPTVWQRSPSNRVINRQKNQQSPLVGPPTLVPNKYNSGGTIDIKNEKSDPAMNVNVRAVIAQQLKRKLSNSSLRNNGNGSETETEAENTNENGKMSGGDDLASVERLLDRVKTSNFAQYFNEEGNNNENNSEDNDDRSCDESGEGMSGSEEGDSKTSGGEKKKSAYSSAPHKISCPHCARRFPWTSSLRRHLLTHTGQKPYQCPKCPLLFTTKSNCDRHLARKHNGHSAKNTSDNSTEEDEDDEDGEEDHDEDEPDAEEREAIASAENNETIVSAINCKSTNKPTSLPNGCNSGEDAAFRCHLCEAAAGEREVLLTHMEQEHKETFRMLVSKGALSSSPPSENSETEQVMLDQKDVTHRKVMCVFCVRRFWSVEDLRRHIRSHSGERPFSCPFCSRRFTLKHSMLRHLKKHSNSSTPTGNKSTLGQTSQNNLKNSDLIGRLLGISDDRLVEQLLNKPDAKDAAKILGLGNSQSQQPAAAQVYSKSN